MDKATGLPYDGDIALLMATAGQMPEPENPMGTVEELSELAEQVVDRHGAGPVAEALMMIVADVMALRVSSPGLDAEELMAPALDLADQLAGGDSPARCWASSALADPSAPYPEVPSEEGEAFDLVLGLVAVQLITATQQAATQSRGHAPGGAAPAPTPTDLGWAELT